MMNLVEFFKSMPKKKCTQCGNDIVHEKADCYGNICDDCDSPAR